MKKRNIGLIALVSLLAIVIILYAVIRNATKDSGGGISPPSGEGIYLDRQPSEVEKVTYRTGGSEFTIRLDGNVYVLDEDAEFPLDTTAVGYITNAAARLTYVRRINPEGNELSDYGLKDPHAVIDIVYTDGARLKLSVGNYNVYSEAFYCTTGDGFVYLMGGEFSEAFAYTFKDLIFHDYIETPQYGFSSVTKIEITGGGKNVVYELADKENDVWVKNGKSGDFAYEALNLYNELYKLSLSDWVAYNVDTDGERDVYGLKTPAIRVVFTHIYEEEIEIDGSSSVTQEHEKHTAFLIGAPTEGSDDTNASRYFLFGGGSIVYIVDESDVSDTINSLK